MASRQHETMHFGHHAGDEYVFPFSWSGWLEASEVVNISLVWSNDGAREGFSFCSLPARLTSDHSITERS